MRTAGVRCVHRNLQTYGERVGAPRGRCGCAHPTHYHAASRPRASGETASHLATGRSRVDLDCGWWRAPSGLSTGAQISQDGMKPENFEFGGGVHYTIMHPAVMVASVVTILLMLLLPRKYVVIPFLLCVFMVPRGQQLYVAGLHWYVVRILILAGFVRLARAKFQVAGRLNGIDKAFILWSIYRGVCQMLLFPQRGMVISQGAFWLEAFGVYFLMRYAIQDEEDIARAAKTLAVLAVILGACTLNEHIHHVNVFGYLGGAPITPAVRNGQTRAQVIFGHPILAGCFGATMAPLFFWLWKSGRAKALAAAAIGGSIPMALTSNSSTAVLAYVAGVGA